MTLNDIKNEYTHYLKKPDRNGFIQVFCVDTCEICGCEVLAPNGLGIAARPHTLKMLGLKGMDAKPEDEGGYSEIHHAATCSACCYDPDAKKVA